MTRKESGVEESEKLELERRIVDILEKKEEENGRKRFSREKSLKRKGEWNVLFPMEFTLDTSHFEISELNAPAF